MKLCHDTQEHLLSVSSIALAVASPSPKDTLTISLPSGKNQKGYAVSHLLKRREVALAMSLANTA